MKRYFIVLLLAVLCLSFGVSCRQKDETGAEAYAGPVTGDLEITFAAPRGKTDNPNESDSIVIMFNYPMIPLEAIDDRKDPDFVRISPRVKGDFHWLNPKTLTFTPKEQLPCATEFTVSIKEGTQSFQGHYLANEFNWNFQTITPELIRHIPSDKRNWVDLDTNIWLVFNMPVSTNKAESFIYLYSSERGKSDSSLSFSLSHPSREQIEEQNMKYEPQQILLIRPDKLSVGQTYSAEVRSGLPAEEGHLGMHSTRLFSFSTYDAFTFDKLTAQEPHNPSASIGIYFSNPVSYSGLFEHLSFSPEVSIPDYYLNWDQAESSLFLSLPFEPDTEYSVTIQPEIEDMFGNRLGKKIIQKFTTASYPPDLNMNTGNGLLEAYGDRKFPIHSLNKSHVRVQAARISANEVIPILNKQDIFWSRKPFQPKNFYELDRRLSLNQKKNTRTATPFEPDLLLKGKPGWVFLQLDTQSEEKWNRHPKALLQVTDLGITAKYSAANNLIWVTTLSDGKPVADAKVEIRDDDNRVLWSGTTNGNGVAESPGWRELGFKRKNRWDSPRQWIIVHKNNDSAFTNSEWFSGISPYEFGISYDWSPPAVDLNGYIYSDRGIYQAGEKVHLKGIIRENTSRGLVIPDKTKAQLLIWDSLNEKVLEKTIFFNEFGSFSAEYQCPVDAALGTYNVVVKIPESKDSGESPKQFSGDFRIESFRPAQYEIHLKTNQSSYVFGETYTAAVQAGYLSGGAMAGQNLEWHLRLNPFRYSPPGYDDYTFGSHFNWWEDWDRDESRLISSGETKLDEKGKVEIEQELLPENEIDTVSAALETTVTGPDRRQVTSRIQTIVHRGGYYIGIKPSSLFVSEEEDLNIDIIAASPEGELISGKNIQVQLILREWHSVRKSSIGGRFRWTSEQKDTLVETQKIKSRGQAQNVIFHPDKSGFYLIRAEGQDRTGNTIRTTTSVYITGKDYIPWERDNDDTIEVIPDSSHYRPGDTAELLIKSPYEKTLALITVERESVLTTRMIEIEGSMHTFQLPVTSEHIPNVYVSVILVQGRSDTVPEEGRTGSDLGKPSFKLGYCQLNVDPSEKKLAVEAQTDQETYQPGENVKLDFRVLSPDGKGVPAEVSVAVVDVGVLNLIGFQTPDPFSYFYRDHPLSVHTTETRHHVISQIFFGEKGENMSGAVGEARAPGFASLSEILLRKDFRPLAYWNPDFITGDDGRGQVEFTLPDNLTKFRIMLVAMTKDARFGRGTTDFQVNKPLLLRPSIPRFTRMEDKFKAGVVVQNNSPEDGEVTLQCSADGIAMARSDQKHEIFLRKGDSQEILFDFIADKPGRARFTFRAVMGPHSDGLEAEIPVEQPRQSETAAVFKQTKESASEIIQIPKKAYPEYTSLDFYASPSALTGIRGSLSYLSEYPYLCLEQRISSILPFLVAGDIIHDFSLSPRSTEDNRRYVEETLSALYSYQNSDGGFGLWPDSYGSSPFLSGYTAFCLMQAQKTGHRISRPSLNRVMDYLEQAAADKLRFNNHPYSRETKLSVRAFSLYLLALNGRPEPGYTEKLYEERSHLTTFGKTMLLKAMHHAGGYPEAKKILLQDLMNAIKVSPTHAYFDDDEGSLGAWFYSSSLRTTAIVLQTLLELDIHNDFIPAMVSWMISRRQAGRWSSTQENFYAFYALNQYYRKYEESDPDFVLDVKLETERLLKTSMTEVTNSIRRDLPLEKWAPGEKKTLTIDKSGPGSLYYETRMHYVPSQSSGPRDEGFSIQKQFLSLEGEPLTEFKSGEMVIVSLRIITPQERLFVVVDDPVPAGVEAVNPDFKIESREMQRKMRQWARQIENNSPFWRGFNHVEIHSDRVRLFADSLAPGIHYHHYLARILLPGKFQLPPTKAEEMYSPEVFGRNDEKVITINRR
jgi:hypothetical protein